MLAFLSRYKKSARAADGTIFVGYSINKSVAGAIDTKKKCARSKDFGLVALSQRLKGRKEVVAVPSAWRRRGDAAAVRSLRTRASHSLCGGRHGPEVAGKPKTHSSFRQKE